MSNIISVGNVFEDADWIKTDDAIKVALVFSCVSIFVSFLHIIRHLKNYTMPEVQLYVIRILLTCPVYAVTSTIALTLGPNGIYAEVLRDVYEAVVVYSFMHLMLEFSGGETDCVYLMENEPRLRLPCPLCCLKPRARTMRLLRFCQRGVIQFILTQPSVALISVVLLATGQYFSPAWQVTETVIYNISYAWALYCLYVFYLAIKQNIKNFRPIAKFASVKSIIFATYYQSLFLKLALSNNEYAILWNDLLLCIEMVVFATALMFAFPVSDFQGGVPDRRVLENVKDVFTLKDILHDVYHNFTSTYDDYALQRSETETPANAAGIMNVRNRLTVRSPSVQNITSSSSSGGGDNNGGDPSSTLSSSFNSESTLEHLESGQLNGKLGSVAQQMSQRYRGRSKRLAFNALLRGSQPIRATLRPSRKHQYYSEQDVTADLRHSHNIPGDGGGDPDRVYTSDDSPLNPLMTDEDADLVEIVFDNSNNNNTNNNHMTADSSSHSTASTSNNSNSSSNSNAHSSRYNTAITDASCISEQPRIDVGAAVSHLGRLTLSLKPSRSPNNSNNNTMAANISWPKFSSGDDIDAASSGIDKSVPSRSNSNSNGNSTYDIELTERTEVKASAAFDHKPAEFRKDRQTPGQHSLHIAATRASPTAETVEGNNEVETVWGDFT